METFLHTLRRADQGVTGSFDRAFAPAHNPWRHLGALAFLCLVTAMATGIVAYAWYDTSVQGAYASGLRLQNDPLLLGRLLRGLHRYAADACILLSVLHLLREAARGHFRGVRWYSWLTGIALVGLVWLSGVTGLWLLWDARALFSLSATAEWLQVLPLGADLLVRNVLTPAALNDRFFSLLMFVHIGLPLLLLAGTWIHVQRITLARMWPPKALALQTLAMLAALALLWPAVSLGQADTSRVISVLSLDWFYLFVHPLVQALSAQTVWWMAAGLTAALALMPLLRPAAAARRAVARVDLAHCNGCARCVADCPFGAVSMLARTDLTRHALQASVQSDLCAACGICVGSCPSATPFRSGEAMVSGIDMPDMPIARIRRDLRDKLAALPQSPKMVLFSCRHAADCSGRANPTTLVMTLECAAMLPPSFIEYALRLGAAGVLIAGCRAGDCEYRLGDQWVHERLLGLREPHLRASVARDQVSVQWCGNQVADIDAALADLRAR